MNDKIAVLVFPCGEINAAELHDALSSCVNIRLYGVVFRLGRFLYKNYIPGLPKISEPEFITCLNRLIVQHHIDVVFPTHDDVVQFMAVHRKEIHAKILSADAATSAVCRDKKKTYETFSDCGFCPNVFSWPLEPCHFPVFVKPRKGQGSVGAKVAHGYCDLPPDLEHYIACEVLPGEECTVDCFTGKDGDLQVVLPRSRQRIFGGVSVRSENEPLTDEIEQIASVINARLHFLGLWYFQIKRDATGRFKLLEISARCAGTMCLSRMRGANMPLLSVYAAMGRETSVLLNQMEITVDRTLISRYQTDLAYSSVYIDLDDTIVIDGKVNLQAIRFLYQCANDGKHLFLLTRHNAHHTDSAEETLRRHKISQALFERIIHLGADENKANAIDPHAAIFIDNAFAERKAVHERHGIPVFDTDAFELLLDWRT